MVNMAKKNNRKSKMALRSRYPIMKQQRTIYGITDNEIENEPQQRELMRPWLLKQIEHKTIPGLQWHNKDEKMVKIPWTHGSRQGFDVQKDACLFKSWAIHTGKYREGDECNPKRWKANFRCAMNSLNDVQEVKHLSKSRGTNAFKIYQFLGEKKPTKKALKKKDKISPTQEDYYKKYAITADRQEMLRKIKEKVQRQQKQRSISDLSVQSTMDTSDYCSGSDETDSIESEYSNGSQISVSSGISVDESLSQIPTNYHEHSYATTQSPFARSPPSASIPTFVEAIQDLSCTSQPPATTTTTTTISDVTNSHLSHLYSMPNTQVAPNVRSNQTPEQMLSHMYYGQTGYGQMFDDLSLQQDMLTTSLQYGPSANGECETDVEWTSSFNSSHNSTWSALLNGSGQSSGYQNEFSLPPAEQESEYIIPTGVDSSVIGDGSSVVVTSSNSTYASTYTAQYENPDHRLVEFKDY